MSLSLQIHLSGKESPMRLKELTYSMKKGLPDYGSQGLSLTAELESKDKVHECYTKLKSLVESHINEASPKQNNQEDRKNGNNGQSNNVPMTGSQKRYLFRLLADQGIEGDAAHAYLKEAFSVASLKEVTKSQASRKIKELLND
jgi:hypothetical protein